MLTVTIIILVILTGAVYLWNNDTLFGEPASSKFASMILAAFGVSIGYMSFPYFIDILKTVPIVKKKLFYNIKSEPYITFTHSVLVSRERTDELGLEHKAQSLNLVPISMSRSLDSDTRIINELYYQVQKYFSKSYEKYYELEDYEQVVGILQTILDEILKQRS